MEAVEDQVTKLHCAVLIHNQYIDKYDALSLANLDIDPNGLVVGELPQLSSLRILCRLLSDALNRGHISQQSLFASIQSIIAQISQKLSLENPTDDDISANFRSVQSMEVKKSLQDIYISISSLSEAKLSLFRCIQEIFAHYEERLVDLAETNGVLYAAVKYQVVSTDLVQSVLSHKFFTTQEEHSILSSTRNSWGRLVLSGNVSEELSDKDLQRLVSIRFYGCFE